MAQATHKQTHNTKVPIISRDKWKSHANYPSQALLLGSHEGFRRVSRYLIDQARGLKPDDATTPLRQLFTRWRGAMRSHEGYEEGRLYPFLELRWGVQLDPLEQQHKHLGELARTVMRSWDGDKAALVTALEAHDLALVAHLNAEEERVIPMLLELSRAEFEIYT